jgi:hypothetical protein
MYVQFPLALITVEALDAMTCRPSSCCYHRLLVVVFVFVFFFVVVGISTVAVAVGVALPESAAPLRVEETLQQEALLTHFHIGRHIGEGDVGPVVAGAQGGHLQTVQVRVPSNGMR